MAGTASGEESERPALLARQAAETHAKAAADQVRRVEQLCGDCEWGARSDALAVTRPTVWGEGAVYRLAHESAKDSTAAGPGAGTADCVDRRETVPKTHPRRERPSHGSLCLNPAVLRSRGPIPVQNASRRAKSGKLQSVVLRSDPGVGNRMLTAPTCRIASEFAYCSGELS